MLKRLTQILITITIAFMLAACQSQDSEYEQTINKWHQLRIDSLKGKTGFINLAGLYWLKEGVNTFGSDSTNNFVFPKDSPPQLGALLLKDTSVYLVPNQSMKVNSYSTDDTTLVYSGEVDYNMSYESLFWFVIKRGNELGIRLRDFEHPLLQTFDSIDYYPTNSGWRFEAIWKPYREIKEVELHNIVGMKLSYPIKGAFSFEFEGNEYKLEPIGEPKPEGYFVMFYDKTSGQSTSGGGRYLYVAIPDADGHTTVDFNKAYNPPCAFTEFATCLFPHKENRLPIFIEAGEKFSGH